MPGQLDSHWPPAINALSARRRLWAIGAAIVTPRVLIGVLNNIQPGAPPDRGLAACISLSGLNQAGAPDFRRLRADFAASRWLDLRAAGTAYTDLAIKLRRPQYTDGYESVSYYQRLAAACAKHGPVLNARI
jgi:hypothetical protein